MMFDPKKDPTGAIENVACVLGFIDDVIMNMSMGGDWERRAYDGMCFILGECRETLVEAVGTIKGV